MESGAPDLLSYFSFPPQQKAARVETREKSFGWGFLNNLLNATFSTLLLFLFAALLGLTVVFFTLCSCMEDKEETEENVNISIDVFFSTDGFVKIVMMVFKKISKSLAKSVVKKVFKNPYY